MIQLDEPAPDQGSSPSYLAKPKQSKKQLDRVMDRFTNHSRMLTKKMQSLTKRLDFETEKNFKESYNYFKVQNNKKIAELKAMSVSNNSGH